MEVVGVDLRGCCSIVDSLRDHRVSDSPESEEGLSFIASVLELLGRATTLRHELALKDHVGNGVREVFGIFILAVIVVRIVGLQVVLLVDLLGFLARVDDKVEIVAIACEICVRIIV